jgi:hypothetical protein
MRRFNILIIILALYAGIAYLNASPAQAVNYLEDIKVQKAADSIAVIITTSQPCEYNAFLTTTKPARIVLDLAGVENIWPRKKFMELPLESIEAIRTSQFKVDPEPVSRVVLDIGREVKFRNFQTGNDIVVKLAAVEDETEFADWSVKGVRELTTKTTRAKPKPEAKKSAAPPKQQAAKAKEQPATEKRKASGVEIESYPKRDLVAYNTSNFRDPFEPLIGIQGGHAGGGLPSLENLTLVGILTDPDGRRALLEDSEGNGYMLMPQDRVKNGYLVSVTDNKAIFQITEYGWTRTVALELDLLEIK